LRVEEAAEAVVHMQPNLVLRLDRDGQVAVAIAVEVANAEACWAQARRELLARPKFNPPRPWRITIPPDPPLFV
jgi:hypothetical protein